MLDMLPRLWPEGDHQVKGLVAGIMAAAPEVFKDQPNLVIAHAMAQFSHECGAGVEMVENLNYSAPRLMQVWPSRFGAGKAAQYAHKPQMIANVVYNGRMGNRPGSNDGWLYRGRGLAQTTGREEYDRVGKLAGQDFLTHPDGVNDPVHALQVGWVNFVSCGCLPFAKADNFHMVTQRLNGGQIGAGERAIWLHRWKLALHV